MDAQKLKVKRTQRRQHRVRKALYGTPQVPRLSVFRSSLHIYAQLIDDLNGVTLAAATSAGKTSGLKHGSNIAAATAVGKSLAEKAKEKGISKAAFDRGPYRFHGRVEALAVAATQAGLVCTDLESLKAKHAAKAPAEAAPEKPVKAPKLDKAEAKAKGDAAKKEKAEKGDKK